MNPKYTVFIIQSFTLSLAILLSILAGFRPFGEGLDFGNYKAFFDKLALNDDFSLFRFEPAFVYASHFAKFRLGVDISFFFFFVVLCCLGIKFHYFMKLRHPLMAILTYSLMWFPLHENTQIRAAISISIIFISIDFMFKSRWIVFILLSLFAAVFHISAILGTAFILVAYLIRDFKLNSIAVVAILLGVTLSVLLPQIMPILHLIRGDNIEYDLAWSMRPNIFTGVNIVAVLFLTFYSFLGLSQTAKDRFYFACTCFSFSVVFGFMEFPLIANRGREILFVFIVMIAFEYKHTYRTLIPFLCALTLTVGIFALNLNMGLFSD